MLHSQRRRPAAAIHPARSRHGRDAAAGAPTGDGRAVSAAIHASSSCRSRAECQRASGSFSRHFLTTRSSDGGESGPQRRDRRRIVLEDGPDQARARPAFERLAAGEHLVEHGAEREDSLRASASWPSSCSGAMYWTVPRIVPCAVRFAGVVGNIDWPTPLTTGVLLFASPKSSSLAPPFVSMMLPGFRSRWMMPARCAVSSADAISIAVLQRLVERQRSLREPVGQRPTVEILHDQEGRALLLADVVQRADVRMRELRDRAGFAIEPLAELRVGCECVGRGP